MYLVLVLWLPFVSKWLLVLVLNPLCLRPLFPGLPVSFSYSFVSSAWRSKPGVSNSRPQGHLSLQHRQFLVFLEELEFEHGDVFYFTEVRWLSRGKVLKRPFELRAEVKRFMENGRRDVPELDDPQWVMDLAFFCGHNIRELNILYLKLQGPGQFLTAVCVKLFSTMNFKECMYRSRLTDAHLEAELRVFICDLHQGQCGSAMWAEVLQVSGKT